MFYARKLQIALTLGHFATYICYCLAPFPTQTTESKQTEIVP